MNVTNIHTRIINQPIHEFPQLIKTLASKNDQVWPHEKWPKIVLDAGLQIGAHGGHGPIRYTVSDYLPNSYIEFTFTKPRGFKGKHMFTFRSIGDEQTKLKHEIKMRARGISCLQWLIAIRPLHDALIEDCFDKIENHFLSEKKRTNWSLWVIFLRKLLA